MPDLERVGNRRISSKGMEQRISLVTLGVADLGRSREFYQHLGWHGQAVQETVFFQAGGQAVVLWSRAKLAADCGIADDGSARFSGIALAQNVRSRAEVDEVMEAAEQAGAEVTKRAAETFYGGYAGYFKDPDGHAWEIAFNPGFSLDAEGNLVLPDFGADT
jgi:predicted lactoylglutathione lyase